MVSAFILLVGLFFFPYSPRWLASKDRWDEARNLLDGFPTAILSTRFSSTNPRWPRLEAAAIENGRDPK
ncbi:hypothetical protein V8F33_002618 [Rhypophila sp. PSN 637]